MRNWRLATFFSFVTIVLSSRRQSSRGGTLALKAVSPLSTKGIVRPEIHYVCSPPPVAATAVITSFATKSRMSTWSLNMATSSSDLKNDITQTKILTTRVDEGVIKKKKQSEKDLEDTSKKQAKRFKGISNNVVSRLAKAAKEAAVKKRKTTTATAKEKKKATRSAGPSFNDYTKDTLCFDDDCPLFDDDEDSDENQDDLSSIMKLNNVIDEELLRPTDGYKPSRETDSIRVLLEHNNNQNRNSGRPTFNKSVVSSSSSELLKNKKNGKNNDNNMTHKDVAIVFARPLSEDQLTIEYAVRLVSLAKAMKFEGYKPNLICFMGPASSFASSWSPSSLNPVVKKMLNKKYLEKWLEESKAYESDMDEYGMTRQEPRKKIHIHWKLFSTEYHLCNLNDIHIRSPRQSPLARLMHDLEHAARSEHYRRGIIQTTWSFHYSVYPYVVSSNKEKMKEAFLGKCYLMAQSLVPLLVNLKGVAENSEFFQRDNYRTLVATRRSLATLLEQMNEAYRHNRERQTATMVIPPTLKVQLKKQTSGSSTTLSSTEIHLECALLSLGRCCDLVRPAGTFSEQSVSRQEWKDALLHLQEFMNRIECSCDPDRPVSADQWGGELNEDRSVMEFLL